MNPKQIRNGFLFRFLFSFFDGEQCTIMEMIRELLLESHFVLRADGTTPCRENNSQWRWWSTSNAKKCPKISSTIRTSNWCNVPVVVNLSPRSHSMPPTPPFVLTSFFVFYFSFVLSCAFWIKFLVFIAQVLALSLSLSMIRLSSSLLWFWPHSCVWRVYLAYGLQHQNIENMLTISGR